MEFDDITEFTWRLAALEERVRTLEGPQVKPESAGDIDGTVCYRGNVTIGDARYAYEWERPTKFLTETPWDKAMEDLSATAHPVRGRILQHLLHHPATVAELVEAGIVTSTGTAYHHLSALHSAGWIEKGGQGAHSIKPKRVVALLAIILAMEES